MSANRSWDRRRKRVYEIVNVGASEDFISRAYDFLNTFVIVVNLASNILYTFREAREAYGGLLLGIEAVTAAFFAVDYALRVWTARFLYPSHTGPKALVKYVFSFTGLVDLLSFLPYYLPVFFPAGTVAFRMFRVVRIFRLFRLNKYYDALNVIAEVISGKRQQLLSSVFIILVLMLASSLCMYSLEHEAQPEVFANAFSGLWWAVSTLLTVGYGDIYPITPMGRVFSIVITFLGVGMAAIPTGIISAGFVDQYSRIKRISEYAAEQDVHFIKIALTGKDAWTKKTVRDLGLPAGVILAVIQRGRETVIPRGDVMLKAGDALVLGAEPLRGESLRDRPFGDGGHIELKEIILKKRHPWNGRPIRDLDISRQTMIVMVRRRGKALIPNGDLALLEGDKIILYTKLHGKDAKNVPL